MSVLAPLYALAAFAIAGPILFHLLQRQPEGQQDFSSLMFLKPSPPQLTKRTRLSNLLLLLLRAGALALLALAFMRPFLRSTTLLDLDVPARSLALVVDTSASMRRIGVWQQLQAQIEEVIRDLRPVDEVTLIAFDQRPTTLVSFEAWEETDPSRRIALLKESVEKLEPTWQSTHLGQAVVYASDSLLQQKLLKDHKHALQLILFSDLQQGSMLEALQAYRWSEEVFVELRVATAEKSSNSSLKLLPPAIDETDASRVRILVRNVGDADKAQFRVAWEGTETVSSREIHVPPGQTRVVRITQPPSASQLTIDGDDQPFDNTLYVTQTERQKRRLVYIGDEPNEAEQGLYFFLQRASLDTRTQDVSTERLTNVAELATLDVQQSPMVVLGKELTGTAVEDLQRYVRNGGRLLVVLPEAADEETAGFISTLLGIGPVSLESVVSDDYAMLARVDFQHPLFVPFDDARFSDFTKIQFWKHRRLTCSDEDAWNVLAQFDDDSPALVERVIGQGKVWVLTSGWNTADSELGLSSKFIPLLHGMFGDDTGTIADLTGYEVGQPIRFTPHNQGTTVFCPSGPPVSLKAEDTHFDGTNEPGTYAFRQGDEEFAVAVNLGHDESRTAPMTPDRLEQLGVKLGQHQSVEVTREQHRQMRNVELEGRQKLWRWGVLAALVAVTLETWLSGRMRPVAVPTT